MGLKKVQAKIRQLEDTYNVYLYATKSLWKLTTTNDTHLIGKNSKIESKHNHALKKLGCNCAKIERIDKWAWRELKQKW